MMLYLMWGTISPLYLSMVPDVAKAIQSTSYYGTIGHEDSIEVLFEIINQMRSGKEVNKYHELTSTFYNNENIIEIIP